jgi:hypothetical protein
MFMSKTWKLKVAVAFGIVCLPAAAPAQTCGFIGLNNPAFQKSHPASELCSSSDANVGAITYNTVGWVYNNSSTATRAVTCAMPNVRGSATKVGAIITLDPNTPTSPQTSCTLRVWNGGQSVVYSDTETGPCSQALLVEGLSGMNWFSGVRCTMPKKGSAIPAITELTEATW